MRLRLIPILFTLLFAWMTRPAAAQCTAAVNGTIYQVTTDADAGPGSLRQAIIDANASGIGGTIEITGGFTNFPIFSQLPVVTCDSLVIFPYLFPITIDGSGFVPEPGIPFATETSCSGVQVSGINFAPVTFTVTNVNDAGLGSLRTAIRSSNFSASADAIHFDIPGIAPHSIQLVTPLPNVYRPLIIDGSTQPPNGYLGTAPKIEVAGTGGNSSGFYFNYASSPYQYNAEVYGVYMHGFGTAIQTSRCSTFTIGEYLSINVISGNTNGIYLDADQTDNVVNNYIGTDPSGSTAEGNVNAGLSVAGIATGTYLISFNVVSGNEHAGMILYGNTRNVTIKSNFVGTDRLAGYAIPNHDFGIMSSAGLVTIGGTQNGNANIFSGNGVISGVSNKAALVLFGDSCIVIGNKFGTDITGTDSIPNVDCAALDLNGRGNRIGGATNPERNVFLANPIGISGSLGVHNTISKNVFGIAISGASYPNGVAISLGSDSCTITGNKILNNTTGIEFVGSATGNVVSLNEIYNNTGDGIINQGTSNKFSQNATYNNGNKAIHNYLGGNNNIQPPVITFCSADSVTGTAQPGSTIEVYYSQSLNSNPQGQTLFGTSFVSPAGTWKLISSILNPSIVTATQTDQGSNTSEFAELFIFSPDNVWPGDCNYDLTADNLDFVYLGMAYGNSGPLRAGASNSWVAQPAPDWGTAFASGVNHKHADCDGNGMVDLADTTAISLNYGMTHPFRLQPETPSSTVYNFHVQAVLDTVAPGAYALFDLYAGSSVYPVDSLYGLAWELIWDATLVDAAGINMDYSNSALGTWHAGMESFEHPLYLAGATDLAVTRTTHTDTTQLNGLIGRFRLPTSPSITTITYLSLNPVAIRARKISGNPVYFTLAGDTVVVDPAYSGIPAIENSTGLQLFPNPSRDVLHVELPREQLRTIRIYDLPGHQIRSVTLTGSGSQAEVPIRDLNPGTYVLVAGNEAGQEFRHLFVKSR